jgi:hypothetical protein
VYANFEPCAHIEKTVIELSRLGSELVAISHAVATKTVGGNWIRDHIETSKCV